MKETCLNVMGYDDMKAKVQFMFASLSAEQAISYRYQRVFEHEKVQLCAYHGMVRSETGSAGVMFARGPGTSSVMWSSGLQRSGWARRPC